MAVKKSVLAIVNRSFKYDSPIGEGLLQFAELASVKGTVCVITQAEGDLRADLDAAGRGNGVLIRACKSYTYSASGVIQRSFEAVLFMLWTLTSLLRAKPANVYVATDPPVLVPFIVALYCRFFGARYVYHLQDIHPEAANIVVPLNGLLMRILLAIDNFTLSHAKALVTLSEDMKAHILNRCDTQSSIYLLDNPSFDIVPVPIEERSKDIVFCGNAGRFQRIPLLLAAIRDYLQLGGTLNFSFAGGGLYAPDLKSLAGTYDQVNYLGLIPASDASELVAQHRWALLPIDDEVTKYAFPSKSSGYALSGACVLAVCGSGTSVARWVMQHGMGVVCEADHDALVRCFFSLEKDTNCSFWMSNDMRARLQIPYFAKRLSEICLDLDAPKFPLKNHF